jgi:hypothetical protein
MGTVSPETVVVADYVLQPWSRLEVHVLAILFVPPMSVSLDSVHQQPVKLRLEDTVLLAAIAHQEVVFLVFALVPEPSQSVASVPET